VHRKTWHKLYNFLLYSRNIAWIILGAVVVSLSLPDDQFSDLSPWVVSTHQWIKSASHWIILIFFVYFSIATLITRILGPLWIATTIHEFLNGFQRYLFNDRSTKDLHHHRITVFKYKRRLLTPVARSGHTTQKSKTTFQAPDEADKAEGIAGKTWACGDIVSVSDLPEVHENVHDDMINEYAEKTYVSTDWVWDQIHKDKSLARALCGIPIENNGKIWGVVVLDSREPKEIGTKESFEIYRLFGNHIGKLLERAKL
jgi:hypothetical protein